MGGYGVYRTFYETPGKFRGLTVFSGNPSLANDWFPGKGYPNFTKPELQTLFREIPVFIYHGEKDRNAPYHLTKKLVDKLKGLGCQVEFYPEADKGHEEASDETYDAYYAWIERILQEE